MNISEFTDDEIREQLSCFGFKNVPKEKFNKFKTELEKLITQEMSITASESSPNGYDQDLKRPHNNNLIKKVTFPDEDRVFTGDLESADQSFASITTTESIVNNKVVKRKIVRKMPNKTDDNPEDELVKGLESLRNPSQYEEDDTLKEDEDIDSQYHSSEEDHYVKLNDCYAPINYPIKSFIRPYRSQSSLSLRSDISIRSMKVNPVNKYHEYKKMWNKQKGPGEKSHSDLRWSIREQMLEKHVIVRRQPRVYRPNEYLIPTEKKRQDLRWVVRSALANPF